MSASTDDPKQRVVADWHHEAACEACGGPAAQREAEVMDDMIQSPRAARPWRKRVVGKALSENLADAPHDAAAETEDHDGEVNAAAPKRQVHHGPTIAAVNTALVTRI